VSASGSGSALTLTFTLTTTSPSLHTAPALYYYLLTTSQLSANPNVSHALSTAGSSSAVLCEAAVNSLWNESSSGSGSGVGSARSVHGLEAVSSGVWCSGVMQWKSGVFTPKVVVESWTVLCDDGM